MQEQLNSNIFTGKILFPNQQIFFFVKPETNDIADLKELTFMYLVVNFKTKLKCVAPTIHTTVTVCLLEGILTVYHCQHV